METKDIVQDQEIELNLKSYGWKKDIEEGRLMILELLSKAGAGYYNSHTEEGYLMMFGLTKKNRQPNKRGLQFIQSMVYASSNEKPYCFNLMNKYRS
tara:strand:+ start:1420 stop:1710 length:291 start_codon:yes stop_codon:yes gene_type:complete